MAAPNPYKPGQYNDPANGKPSSIGVQVNTSYWMKQALIEARKEAYFGQLADTFSMPKNFGKEIVRMHYLPLLDDRNINDQGIDANGAIIANGNLYGSSKDVGTIPAKMPTLTEVGGRVNRVGFKRLVIKGKLEKYGFFREYTQESLDFDSDSELESHVNREMLKGANEITEALLQLDLLNAAGVVRYPGAAMSAAQLGPDNTVTYNDLVRLNIDLDNNRAPKATKMITGTRLEDTRTVPNRRVMYIGSELLPMLRDMKDNHGNPAFIDLHKYAASGNTFIGEIGAIDSFAIVVNPEMFRWEGAGAAVGTDPDDEGYYDNGAKYDVFPMLVVSSEAFTTVGFQTDGKNVKFKIYNKKPGEETVSALDPYGELGLMSIKWYYGFMVYRPEWIALLKTTAKL